MFEMTDLADSKVDFWDKLSAVGMMPCGTKL